MIYIRELLDSSHQILVYLLNDAGISLEKNVLLKKLPSSIFENVATLKRVRIVEPLETVIENLSLQLENLEELRIVGSAYYKPTLPTQFLHSS